MILNINQINFKKIRNLGDFLASQSSLIDIEDSFIFGNKINNTASMFNGCWRLKNIPNFDTSNVIDMSCMFSNCWNLTTIPNFNTSNVKLVEYMFEGCNNLITVPNFNTINVIYMRNMFSGCINLTSVPNFNTSNVEDMSGMFYGCWNLQNTPTLNISNVTDMGYMFAACENLRNVAIFNSVANAQTQMYCMFYNCYNLATLNSNTLISLFNQANDMQSMFSKCNSLTQSSINNIVYYLPNTGNLDDSEEDYSLSYLGLSDDQIKMAISNLNACNRAINNGWNIQTTVNYNVLYKTDINATEWTAMPLNNVIISNNAWAIKNCFNANTPNKNTITNLKVNNLPEVTNLHTAFNTTLNLKSIDELNIPKIEQVPFIFENCKNLINVTNINTTNSLINIRGMFRYCRDLTTVPNFNTINVTNMGYMFDGCENLTTVPNFDTSNVTNIHSIFSRCYNLTTVPNFNTINVTDMVDAFESCNHLTTVPNFNTTKVMNISWMFAYCYNLTAIPNFNTSNVMNMVSMFVSCYNLTTVPNFNTINVTDMSGMFQSCFNLTTVPNFNTSNVKDMHLMFDSCNHLTTIFNFNTSKVINIRNMFSNCKNLLLSSCENILYSIPYYNNITDINKYPMINYFANNSALTNNDMIANLNSAAINAAEEKGWFVTPAIKIDYTLLNGATGTNKISINGMNGLEQVANLRNMIQSSYTWNQANKLIISGTSENLELTQLGWGYIGPASVGSFFRNVSNLDFVGINTASATNGYEAFCQSQEMVNLNGLKTNSIINGVEMFSECPRLNIQWNSWNFSNLQNAHSMFEYCNLVNLPGISSLMPNVTNMKSIFKNSEITNNTMQNIIKMIPDYTQLIDDINPDNTLNYLGITNDQINMLSDDYKQMAADKHWNIPGFIAREKVSILPICNNLGAISNYNSYYNEYPMEVIYDDTYGDHFLQSKNQGKGNSTSSAIINFTNELVALCGNRYYMDIYYSCENNYDHLQVFKMNNGSSSWSQIGENKYTGYSGMNYLYSSLDLENVQVGDQLRFTFFKDGNGDRGLDGCLISIYGYKTDGAYEITYSLVEEPEITKYKIIPKE